MEHVPLELTYLVHLRQRHLRNLVLHCQGCITTTQSWLELDELQHLSTVSLHISSNDDCVRGRQMLEQMTHLRNLSIGIGYENSMGAQGVVNILFARWKGKEETRKLQLEELLFRRCDWEGNGQILASVLDMNKLKHLAFIECSETDELLESFLKAPVNLRVFIDEACTNIAEPATRSHEKFLEHFQGLQQLRFTRETNEDLQLSSWKSIRAHGASLRLRFIDDLGRNANPYTLDSTNRRNMAAFRGLCIHCPQLEQLAIQPPPVYHTHDESSYNFQAFLRCLKNLRKLTALRLITYPGLLLQSRGPDVEDKPTIELRDLRLKIEMQELADRIITELYVCCPSFTALVIDARERHQDIGSGDTANSYGCLREIRTDPFKWEKAAGYPIEPHMIKHHEPCSQIFENRIKTL
ncbi:hypothetical protein LTR37_021489 [Vermiconidia calcicola]|uniref:Uncharacterized protein n=1 Tax=Vermiconidia calcicola TaxID=1690605 RepID=A0ACC3MA29_9PEZI|nr:hypothetical protein LTR37_021489 [Vermiconidia calcicola]